MMLGCSSNHWFSGVFGFSWSPLEICGVLVPSLSGSEQSCPQSWADTYQAGLWPCAHGPRRTLGRGGGPGAAQATPRATVLGVGNHMQLQEIPFRLLYSWVCHGALRSFQPLIQFVAQMPTSYFFGY